MQKTICVMTSAHPAFDVRIFHKECKSLAEAGYRVTLIAPHSASLAKDGVQLKATRVRKGRLQRATLGVLDTLAGAVKEKSDLYHFHDPELIPAGLFLRLLGRKVIYDIHEDLPDTLSYKTYLPRRVRSPLRFIVGALEELACRAFSALVTVTPFIAARFRSFNRRIAVVRNYPMLEEFCLSTSEAERSNRFVYMGAKITWARGAKEMVDAMALLPPDQPARLSLIGEFDPPQLRHTLETRPGWQKTDVLGFLGRTQLAEMLPRMCAGLVTIHPEPNYINALPIKLFEYMAAGVPVIASNFPTYRQIVEEARCGILVNPLDPQEIAGAMNYLLAHPKEAHEMGRSGRAAVLHKFNWKKEQQALLDLYDELLFPAPRPAAAPTRQELQ